MRKSCSPEQTRDCDTRYILRWVFYRSVAFSIAGIFLTGITVAWASANWKSKIEAKVNQVEKQIQEVKFIGDKVDSILYYIKLSKENGR